MKRINYVNESKLQEAYQEFFRSKLEEFGVKSPAELDDDKKKEFFNSIKEEWPKVKAEQHLDESADNVLTDALMNASPAKLEEIARDLKLYAADALYANATAKQLRNDIATELTADKIRYKDYVAKLVKECNEAVSDVNKVAFAKAYADSNDFKAVKEVDDILKKAGVRASTAIDVAFASVPTDTQKQLCKVMGVEFVNEAKKSVIAKSFKESTDLNFAKYWQSLTPEQRYYALKLVGLYLRGDEKFVAIVNNSKFETIDILAQKAFIRMYMYYIYKYKNGMYLSEENNLKKEQAYCYDKSGKIVKATILMNSRWKLELFFNGKYNGNVIDMPANFKDLQAASSKYLKASLKQLTSDKVANQYMFESYLYRNEETGEYAYGSYAFEVFYLSNKRCEIESYMDYEIDPFMNEGDDNSDWDELDVDARKELLDGLGFKDKFADMKFEELPDHVKDAISDHADESFINEDWKEEINPYSTAYKKLSKEDKAKFWNAIYSKKEDAETAAAKGFTPLKYADRAYSHGVSPQVVKGNLKKGLAAVGVKADEDAEAGWSYEAMQKWWESKKPEERQKVTGLDDKLCRKSFRTLYFPDMKKVYNALKAGKADESLTLPIRRSAQIAFAYVNEEMTQGDELFLQRDLSTTDGAVIPMGSRIVYTGIDSNTNVATVAFGEDSYAVVVADLVASVA